MAHLTAEQAHISLAILNTRGASASIEDREGNSACIVRRRDSQDPKGICLEAAQELRRLAGLFEKLAECDNAFNEAVQRGLQ